MPRRLSFGRGATLNQRETDVISRYPSGLRLTLLAVAAVTLLPAAAEAAGLAFRNDTDSPLLVQGVSIINRIARRGKLHVLPPGAVSRELVLVPCTVLISVADANQPSRILHQESIQFTGTDLFFAIQAEEPEKVQEKGKASDKATDRKAASKFKLVLLKPAAPSPPPAQRR